MAKCLEILKRCQHADAMLDYGFNWTDQFSRKWAADSPYAIGVTVRPAGDATGFQYSSSGGQSASIEPAWPTAVAGTVVDGSITWTAEALDDTSLEDEIASDVWSTSSPVGLTVTPASPVVTSGMQRTSAVMSGGTSGRTYTVDNEVTTTTGLEYVARVLLTIE